MDVDLGLLPIYRIKNYLHEKNVYEQNKKSKIFL